MNFQEIAKSELGEALIKHFEEIQGTIADIRYKPEIGNEVRRMVIEVLDEMVVNKIKVHRGEVESKDGNNSWN